MGIWLLPVDHNFQALGGPFTVDVDMTSALVYRLKEKVALPRTCVDPRVLTVWKTKGAMVIDKSSSNRLPEILKNIDVGNKDTIEELDGDELVADLGLSDGQTLLVQLPDFVGLNIGIAHAHATVTIDMIPDDVLVEIFGFYFWDLPGGPGFAWATLQWQLLAQVSQRWRRIICASPRYLSLNLICLKKKGFPVKDLGYWPTFPIVMRYNIPGNAEDAFAIFKNPDQVFIVELWIRRSQWGKVIAAMQKPFPMLTVLTLHGYHGRDEPVLTSGFLSGSAPSLRTFDISRLPFPELPTLLLSARDLACLRLDNIPPTGYISPEAMVACLAVLTQLESLSIVFSEPRPRTEQRSRRPDPPIRAFLPALESFGFGGSSEYLDDLVADIDAPQLNSFDTTVDQFPVPQLFQFIGRVESFKFRRVRLDLDQTRYSWEPPRSTPTKDKLRIDLAVDIYRPGEPLPHFFLSAPFDWSGTHVAHIAFVLTQTFTMCLCSDVDYLYIFVNDDHPGWRDDIGIAEWLAFFRLFPTVKTLHIRGMFAAQVARALEDLPEEMVTKVFPSLQILILESKDGEVVSAEQFASLRQLHERPVTIRDRSPSVPAIESDEEEE